MLNHIWEYRNEQIHVDNIIELETQQNHFGGQGWNIFQIIEILDEKNLWDGRFKRKQCFQLFMKKEIQPQHF